MTFWKYLRDHGLLLLAIILGVTFVELVLYLDPNVQFDTGTLLYSWTLAMIIAGLCISVSYIRKKSWYKNLESYQEDLSKELSGAKNNEQLFVQEKINNIVLQYRQELTQLYQNQQDQQEYTESWVHDIKVPLAALKLASNDELDPELLSEETEQIDYLVDQALYFARLNNFSNDYLIKEQDLNEIVKNSIRTNKRSFINKRIGIDLDVSDQPVLTDSKWLSFILNQILANSLKYTAAGGKIQIFTTSEKQNILLHIKDNGIGIKTEDRTRVFNKGFTGSNGRTSGSKATGIGLYLVKKMIDRLGHLIEIKSTVGKGTEVIITFIDLPYYYSQG
ncbi:sensor histidine kinase [Companilactobacillus furfuricola]|uniref:sensor histidine kinase n=1 Tax=Companilactobacillus furfuricola TaxID=1462575 RepID=UPI000F796BC7|nr:sensor histidine kinase [Companilactobacillus furfuricola]